MNSTKGADIIPPWEGGPLTWEISDPLAGIDLGCLETCIEQAFTEWAKHVPFGIERAAHDKPWITIKWVSGEHDKCKYSFDGPGGNVENVLAHAVYIMDNDQVEIHFDAEEPWSARTAGEPCHGYSAPGAYDVSRVALHEIGHALGLPHIETDPRTVMHPSNFFRASWFELHKKDIALVESVYGHHARPAGGSLGI